MTALMSINRMERLAAAVQLQLNRALALCGVLPPNKKVDAGLVNAPERIIFGSGRKAIGSSPNVLNRTAPIAVGDSTKKQWQYADLAKAAFTHGRFDDCKLFLTQALAIDTTASELRVHLLGYLGCISARNQDLVAAKDAFEECCRNIEWLISCHHDCCELCELQMQLRRCWATGNLGLVNLQLSSMAEGDQEADLENEAIDRLAEQLEMAHSTIKRLRSNPSVSEVRRKLLASAKYYESFAMNRLVLCYAQRGNQTLAMRLAKQSCRLAELDADCESLEVARICYAHALAQFGMREEAGRQLASLIRPGTDEAAARQELANKAEKMTRPILWRGGPSSTPHRTSHPAT